MLTLEFMPRAWEDLGWWVKNDIKSVKRIYLLLENCCKTPFDGIGQPEALKANYSGYWSRRINQEDRIVYKIEADKIVVHSMKGHYK